MEELNLPALRENLDQVMGFVEEHLEQVGCPAKTVLQVSMAVEEIFINIASYAYDPKVGPATIRVEVKEEPLCVIITFVDHGRPYDPLAREDPDVTLPAEQRQVGGLGIFLVKKTMDDIRYEYKDGSNILTITKGW